MLLPLKQELEQRWLLKQYTDEKLFDLYDHGGQKFYFGMDPTADSLHLGNFVNFINAVHLMRRWNICIPLVGGATGMIGDPGWKDSERSFLDEGTLAHNVSAIQDQINALIANIVEVTGENLKTSPVVNNKDFYEGMSFLDFLREAGKYITVNSMLTKETVKKRIEDPDKSISYTEFSYMLIQGYDFYKLYQTQWCKLQIAGSDQWGNVTTGTEIIRKKTGEEAYAFTCPLVLDSAGKKFGKSEGNAIWLDRKKNSPYYVYQYFLNTTDADVERFLNLFTLYDFDIIAQIVATHQQDLSARYGQSMLAEYVTKLIFWPDAARQAQMITSILFGKGDVMETIKWLSAEDLDALMQETGGVKSEELKANSVGIVDLLVQSWLASSNGEGKKLIQWGGIYVNEQKVEDISMILSSADEINGVILLRKGKKGYRVVRL